MMNAAKINSNIARQALSAQRQQNVSLVARATPISSLHTSATQQKSIIEKAKDLGQEVNKKVGQGLAQGIESAESVAHKAPSPKEVGEKVKKAGQDVNLKVGQNLAHGIENAESLASKAPNAKEVGEKVKETGQEANLKVGQGLAEGIDKVSKTAGNFKSEDVKKAGKQTLSEGVDKVEEAANDAGDRIKKSVNGQK
ncbi:hypothetical protein [Absidia glauca]|uniref:Uncharacterized protein n=1 Tax=Absidia glauca TaxID=4829 RepID=A0A163JBW5_ABSGL|nr:hypothetical protein [Absidia glauca]